MFILNESAVSSVSFPDFSLWEKIKYKRIPLSFDLEVTARCNNDCRHCFINLPAGDKAAQAEELSVEEIGRIADEAVAMGTVWCLITGGEPLLRKDFPDIYLALKRKGLLLRLFTNAVLVSEEHIRFLKKYPPRDVEVSVYGVTKGTYERVTRRSGSFEAFMRGVNLLLDSGIKVRFKAMALRSNFQEMEEITRFCRERTKDYFRFDPFLHLRADRDPKRNEEIKAERLSPEEIVALEKADPERFQEMEENCDQLINPKFGHLNCKHLFHCGTGLGIFVVSYNGIFRPCSSLWHPDCVYDLRKGSLADAWNNLVPKVRNMTSDRKEFLENCRVCTMKNLCLWCAAHAYLETGELDVPVDYFCRIAHARAKALEEAVSP